MQWKSIILNDYFKKYFKGFTYFKLALKKNEWSWVSEQDSPAGPGSKRFNICMLETRYYSPRWGRVYIKYTFQSTSQHQDALQWKILHTAQQISFKDIIWRNYFCICSNFFTHFHILYKRLCPVQSKIYNYFNSTNGQKSELPSSTSLNHPHTI